MKKLLLAVSLSAALLTGCAARQIHPGAANSFDSQVYDALIVSHSVIETCKADLANGVFSPTLAPKIKTALNDLIKAYDVADTVYQAYHTAAMAGTATTAQATAVSDAIQNVNNSTSALAAAKAGK
jgi:hypothetical protein